MNFLFMKWIKVNFGIFPKIAGSNEGRGERKISLNSMGRSMSMEDYDVPNVRRLSVVNKNWAKHTQQPNERWNCNKPPMEEPEAVEKTGLKVPQFIFKCHSFTYRSIALLTFYRKSFESISIRRSVWQ